MSSRGMLLRMLWARERHLQQVERQRLLADAEKGYGAVVQKGSDSPRRTEDTRPLGQEWMSHLGDDILLSALTIPGTHDSAAFTNAWPFVQTQKMTIIQQLDAGIRYFDLRCGLRDDTVEMVHGSALLGITLSMVLDAMYLWLLSHPTEALVVQIKQDRLSERSTMHFAHAIWKAITLNYRHWRTANTTPTLGELRGKIQLLRRFSGPTLHAYGIDVTQWQDNPSRPFTIDTRHDVQITIQDHYNFPDPTGLPSLIAKKGGDVSELLERAAKNSECGHWFINFTSAYEFNLYYQLPPREIAVGGWWGFRWEDGMNPRIRSYLREHGGKRRYGIIAIDFPESGTDDLITALIWSNFEGSPDIRGRCWWELVLEVVALLVFAVLMTVAVLWLSSARP